MKTKEYRGRYQVHINVTLDSERRRHVSFMPTSDGGSVYITTDTDMQQALERHPRFGRLFTLVSTVDHDETPPKPVATVAENLLPTMAFDSLQEAKEYLAETFGASRSHMTSWNRIKEVGLRHGIQMVNRNDPCAAR